MQELEPNYFPVIPDEKLTLPDNLSLKSNIQPLKRTDDIHCIIEDIKEMENTNTKADVFESSVNERKFMYEYDNVSQTTEAFDKPLDESLTPQEFNFDHSNCLYVREDKLYKTGIPMNVYMATVDEKI